MIVQINTDKTLAADDKMQDYFTVRVKKAMQRYQSHITRVEIHLKDENGEKKGHNDITCLLEVRLKGRQPIAIDCRADTMELALNGAINKIHNAVETIMGRLNN